LGTVGVKSAEESSHPRSVHPAGTPEQRAVYTISDHEIRRYQAVEPITLPRPAVSIANVEGSVPTPELRDAKSGIGRRELCHRQN